MQKIYARQNPLEFFPGFSFSIFYLARFCGQNPRVFRGFFVFNILPPSGFPRVFLGFFPGFFSKI